MSFVKAVRAVLPTRAYPGRAQRALYGGKLKQFGNHVSFSNNRVRRCWNPNVQKKKVYSDVLGRKLSVRMTTYVMRCIDKAGGFDNYILHTKPKDLASKLAMKIRDEMHQVLRAKQLAKAAAKATESKPATA